MLICVFIVAAVLRLWNLGNIPPGLTPDEAAIGYNAYSIIHTGRDEFGKFLPIIFKSFGDYKPGLMVYLTIPSIFVFGLSEFSTRLPSVIAGIISVYMIYLITRRLFNERVGIFAAIVAAVNPYLIYFSRGSWEANVSLTLTLLGIYFFLKAFKENKNLIFSSLFFGSTLLTYQGAKLSTAIVLVLLVIIYWNDFWKISKKYLSASLVLGTIIIFPIFLTLFNGQTQRLAIFSVFSYPRPLIETQTYSGSYFGLFHSDQLNYFRMVMSRWFNFYSGKFMVFEGDSANPVHTPPYQGVLLLADLFTIPFGLFTLFKNKISKGSLFIMLWLLLAPFSAAISRDQTNAVRTLNASVPLVILISLGVYYLISYFSRQKFGFMYNAFLVGFYMFSFVYFLDAYFIHLPAHNSSFWRYGYKEAVNYITPIESKYTNIIFEQSFNQPYIYFLFYQKYDPSYWQHQAKLVSSQYVGDVGFEGSLDNVLFRQIDWSALRSAHDTLVIVGPNTIPPEIKNDPKNFPVIKEIKYLNGRDTAFKIIEIK